MSKKIAIIQHGDDANIFPLLSLVIGFQKAYPGSDILWIGDPIMVDLIRFNKKISRFIDVTKEFTMSTLQTVFGTDICVNISRTNIAKRFASNIGAKEVFGFNKKGPLSRKSRFLGNILSGEISTKKTLLHICYDLTGLRWRGEGYGLSYYPKTKQTQNCGSYFNNAVNVPYWTEMKMPTKILERLDNINQFRQIQTDDLFVAYAAIALRKKCIFFTDNLPFGIEFFGNGEIKSLKEVSCADSNNSA